MLLPTVSWDSTNRMIIRVSLHAVHINGDCFMTMDDQISLSKVFYTTGC